MTTDGAYLIGATRARVIAQFVRHFGHAPARVFRFGSTWRAGPVGNEKRPPVGGGRRAVSGFGFNKATR